MSNLDGIFHYGDTSLSETLTTNIIDFLRYGLLEVGAFYNISKDQINYQGVNESCLAPLVSRGGVNDFTIWVDKKHDWVWETVPTIKYTGGSSPYIPSGIYIDGIFYATGTTITGTGYHLDFSQGRVVFDNPLPSGTHIDLYRSLRYVGVYDADSDVKRRMVGDWLDDNASGTSTTDFSYKAYLPAIFVDLISYQTKKGLELGGRSKNIYANFNFDVIAYNSSDRDRIIDMLYMLETKSFNLYNVADLTRALNYRGELVNPNAVWPSAVVSNPHAGGDARFTENAKVIRVPSDSGPPYRAKVTIGLELNVTPI